VRGGVYVVDVFSLAYLHDFTTKHLFYQDYQFDIFTSNMCSTVGYPHLPMTFPHILRC
jgi:hypothetical protein